MDYYWATWIPCSVPRLGRGPPHCTVAVRSSPSTWRRCARSSVCSPSQRSAHTRVPVPIITPPPKGERGVLWWACLSVCVSLCVSVCLSVHDHASRTTRPIFTNFCACYLWTWLGGPVVVISCVFPYFRNCSTSPPGWGSEAHTYAALGLACRNTRCRQRTLGPTSCSGGVQCFYDIMLAHSVPAYMATRKWRVCLN